MSAKKTKVSRQDLAAMSSKETWALAKETYTKLFAFVRPYKGRFFLGLLLGVMAGLSNAFLVQGMYLVFAVVLAKPEEIADPEKAKDLFEFGFGAYKLNALDYVPTSWIGSDSMLVLACLTVPLVFLLRAGLTYLANYCMMWVGNRVLYDLRNATYGAILKQSLGYFAQAKSGNLVQTVFNQARVAQQNLITLAQDLVQRPVSIIAILATLFYMAPMFTFLALIVFPLCILPVVYIGKKVRSAGTQEEQEAGQMMVQMTETFHGIRVVKALAREHHEMDRFKQSNATMNKLIMRYGKAMELVGMIVEVVASLGVAIGLYYAKKHTNIDGKMFFALIGGLTQIYPHTKALSRVQLMMQKAIVATSSIFATLDQQPDIKDKPDAKVIKRSQGRVRFESVTFGYKSGKPAVKNISFSLEPGKFYALVGPTGAGKSTIFTLLQRFYDVNSGAVYLDDVDIRDVTQESLRNQIGVVNQDAFLFHDTIRENIRYGRLDASEADIMDAARRAHVHDFVKDKKEGYDTVVGDSGGNLSGGQKQRVTIARAILRNAPILLLDEATSALDTETERIIQEAIHELSKGKTVIAIAHRLSTVLEADRIIVMKDGGIDAAGTHQELLQTSELYQRLYQLQFQENNAT
ncbi:MAG: ABC transporter ATP-binding protein [Verrucomicrobiaceae bacterium]|nr:ABC transporter ATP-binding protein [Verrucomicrobiaceae bacterium]